MSNRTSQSSKTFTVSFFGTIATAAAVMVYLFSTTFDPADITHFFTMFLILLAGIVLAFIFVGFKLMPFNFKNLTIDLISTAASFASIYYLNTVVPVNYGVSPISAQAFGVLSGVAEEWFFRMWLCAWVYRMTTSMILAVPFSSFVWAMFHLARYGDNPAMLWLIFLVGLPLGFLTLYFRSADGPMFGHMIINALVG